MLLFGSGFIMFKFYCVSVHGGIYDANGFIFSLIPWFGAIIRLVFRVMIKFSLFFSLLVKFIMEDTFWKEPKLRAYLIFRRFAEFYCWVIFMVLVFM